MKKLLLLLALCGLCGTAAAQDLIVKRNAETIEGKVLRIGGTKIEYTRAGDARGPVFTLSTGEVDYVQYGDGRRETFEPASTTPARIRALRKDNFPHYQGEVAVAYGLGVGDITKAVDTDRILFETVHGVRLSPYAFVGAGAGLNYFYGTRGEDKGAGLVSAFANAKGYYPVSPSTHLYLSLDLGAAIGVWNYMKDWRDLYVAAGPGVTIGNPDDRMRLDLGVRFQYMGEGTKAVLFRIGFGF